MPKNLTVRFYVYVLFEVIHTLQSQITLLEKCSYWEFSGPYFPHLDWIRSLRRINVCKHTSNNKHCEGTFNKSSVSSIEHPRLTCYLRALLGSSALSMRKKCLYSELFWFVFSRIRTEYREIRSTPYSVRMLKNADQNNSEYGPFSGSVW